MNEFILLLILAYSFLFTWSIYHAEKITDNHQRGLIYDSSILSYSLPFCILIFAVGAILFYPKLSADLLIQICTNIFISIIFYYMVFLILLPMIRKKLTVTSIVSLWAMPNLLYLTFHFCKYIEPAIIIETRGKLMYILYGIWLIGFLCVMGWAIIDHLRYRSVILKDAYPLQDEMILSTIQEIRQQLELKNRMPKAVISPFSSTPCSIGLLPWKTVLVLPQKQYSQQQIRLILMHELIHLSRRDQYVRFSLVFMCAICWFNPFMWKAMKKSAEDLERSCDEQVLTGMSEQDRTVYADLILHTACDSHGFTTCLSSSAESLKYRLNSMIDPPATHSGALLCGIVFFSLMLLSSIVNITYDPKPFSQVLLQDNFDQQIQVTHCFDINTNHTLTVKDPDGMAEYLQSMVLSKTAREPQYDFKHHFVIELYTDQADYWINLEDDTIRYYDNTLNLSMQYHVNGGIDWDYLMSITETAE